MVKITIDIEGMSCGMCEAHVNEAVRKTCAAKKVSSSYKNGKTEIIAEEPIDEDMLKNVITSTGYNVISVYTEPYEKKRFSLFKK